MYIITLVVLRGTMESKVESDMH